MNHMVLSYWVCLASTFLYATEPLALTYDFAAKLL